MPNTDGLPDCVALVDDAADTFIEKWQGVAASKLSTSQSFLIDLCGLLGVETPHPTAEQDHMFERPITFAHGADDDIAPEAIAPIIAAKPQPWSKDAVAQVRAVADVIATSPVPLTVDNIAARFGARGPWKKRLPKLLEMLVALGRAQEQDGAFSA